MVNKNLVLGIGVIGAYLLFANKEKVQQGGGGDGGFTIFGGGESGSPVSSGNEGGFLDGLAGLNLKDFFATPEPTFFKQNARGEVALFQGNQGVILDSFGQPIASTTPDIFGNVPQANRFIADKPTKKQATISGSEDTFEPLSQIGLPTASSISGTNIPKSSGSTKKSSKISQNKFSTPAPKQQFFTPANPVGSSFFGGVF